MPRRTFALLLVLLVACADHASANSHDDDKPPPDPCTQDQIPPEEKANPHYHHTYSCPMSKQCAGHCHCECDPHTHMPQCIGQMTEYTFCEAGMFGDDDSSGRRAQEIESIWCAKEVLVLKGSHLARITRSITRILHTL